MKEIELKGLQETVYYDITDHGLPIILWVNQKVKSYYMTLSVKYGSLDTEFKIGNKNYSVPNGVAHFLEHLNFQEEHGEDAQTFYQKNGSDVNAFTTFQYTSYEVYGNDCLKENLIHLLDFVLTPVFHKKMVQNEKNIIVEENKMDLDNPGNVLYYGTFQNLFKNDKHKNYITGTKEDILNTTLEDIELAYHTFYHPSNMFFVITGNFNPYEVATIVKDHLKEKEFLPWKNPKRKELREPSKIIKSYEEITGNVEIPKIRIGIKIPRKAFREKSDYKLRLMLAFLLNSNFGPTSDLYEELLTKDLIVSISGEKSIIGSYVLLFLNVETKYPDEVLPILKQALKNLKMNDKTLKRKLHSSLANMVLSYDDITEVNMSLQEQIMNYGEVLANQRELFESITLKEVKEVIHSISCKEMAVVVLKPE